MSSTEPVAPPRCYVHADRLAGSVCRRCGRPICPDCMQEAPVGWQCRACVKEATRSSPSIGWSAYQGGGGARRGGGLGARWGVGPRGMGRGGTGRLGGTRMTPAVVGLIAANVVVYVWESRHLQANEYRFGMWPNGIHYAHQWYRLITAAFLHASPEHILFNMVTLAIVGPPVEAQIGRLRFLVVYLLSAVGGSVASYLLSPANVVGVGASGAIFGVMGAYFVIARLRRWETRTIVVLIVVNLMLGLLSPGIDWRAHLGGMVVGAVVCLGLVAAPAGRRRVSEVAQLVQGVAVVVAVAVGMGLLLQLPPGHVNL